MASTINETAVYRMMDEIAGLKAELERQKRLINDMAKSHDEKLSQAYVSGIGGGWEAPDGVEFPIGRVEVLVIRPAIWRDDIEEWEDTMTDRYLWGVIAYRDMPHPQEASAP